RLVPFGQQARLWIVRYLEQARAVILDGKVDDAVRDRARWSDDAPDVLGAYQETRGPRRDRRAAVAPYPAPRIRHPPAQPWGRSAGGPAAARSFRYFNHPDLHPCCARTAQTPACRAP